MQHLGSNQRVTDELAYTYAERLRYFRAMTQQLDANLKTVEYDDNDEYGSIVSATDDKI